jgi:hypothetical protein
MAESERLPLAPPAGRGHAAAGDRVVEGVERATLPLDFGLDPFSSPAMPMVPRTVLLAGILGVSAAAAQTPPRALVPDSARIRADIAYLASDRLEGRTTGTPGNDSAAAYIARRYQTLGLSPVMQPTFLQLFVARPAAAAHASAPVALRTENVVAMLPGSDPRLRSEYVVIGAHFDHLGRSTVGALDPEAGPVIRNGADDNASGTAAVLELARLFRNAPTRRSLLFVNFSGEEQGLLGSAWFIEHSPVTVDSMVAMINFDMVGRLRNDRLIVYGVATAKELPALLDSANAGRLRIAAQGDGYGPSDQTSFYAKDVPVLHFFTDLHDDYHRASDHVEKINAGGEAIVVGIAQRVVRAIGDRPARLTFVRSAAPPPSMSSGSGSDVYLGSIPDMAGADVKGLRLTGIRAGSPADSGGLKAGDLVVQLGDATVTDLQSYSDALYAHKPGDEVRIVVLRDGKRLTLTVKLGKRG